MSREAVDRGTNPSPAPPRPGTSPAGMLIFHLQALAEEWPQRPGRAALRSLVQRLERGEVPDEAWRATQPGLPHELSRLITLGLHTGALETLMFDYLEQLRRKNDLRRLLLLSLSYPLGLLVVMGGVLLLVLQNLVPMFHSLFEEFGLQLPWLTEVCLGLSAGLRTWGTTIAGVLLAGLLGGWCVLRGFGGRGAGQRLWRRIPLLGQGLRWVSLANFCQLLATLVELEVPLPQALREAAGVTDDHGLAVDAVRLAAAIEQGVAPHEAVRPARDGLGELAAVFQGANRHDDLVQALRATGEIFLARGRLQVHVLGWLLQPVLLCGLALLVGALVVALFLPLLTLLNFLS